MTRTSEDRARQPQRVAKKLAGWTIEVESGLRLVALVGALSAIRHDVPAAGSLRRERERLPVGRAPP